ncbi:MAG: DUF3795 domain-containing protein [Desulfovibrionaceae bacterium]|nr:DUF3795 domain-containing protein [Desulfovibrionaceae bacterium]
MPGTRQDPSLPTDRTGIAARIAACGLDCGRCLSHPQSPISRHARGLLDGLGNFAARAAFFARLDPVFEHYAAFEAVAKRFAAADCAGCRSGTCLLGHCAVQTCVKERGVDFCCECAEFPCDHTGFSGMLHARWLANNEKMRELGLAGYMEWVAGQARY